MVFGSCVSEEDLNSFHQNINSKKEWNNYSGPILENGDIIQITIYSKDQDLNEIFSPSKTRNSENRQNYISGAPVFGGFTIDTIGCIKLPYLGELKLSGLKKVDAEKLIENRLSEYIIAPVVQVQILNFKISVTGDVKNPGIYQVPNDKINLIEALALSGDLNYTANRRNVKLIRNMNGTINSITIDLTNSDVISSEHFMLKQNDIIYVPTSKLKIRQLNLSQYLSPALSSISILMNLFILLR